MRLFVAIVPPATVLAELHDQVTRLRPAWPGLRWTSPEAWHVTLAFLGDAPDGVLPDLRTRLERAARRHPAVPAAVRGGGAFPAPHRATTVWAGLETDRPALAALAASVAAGARRAGAPSAEEGRRYHPHLTLARLREQADVGPLVAVLADLAGRPWTVGQISLIRSHLPGPGEPGRPPATRNWLAGRCARTGRHRRQGRRPRRARGARRRSRCRR